eukprot:98367_1
MLSNKYRYNLVNMISTLYLLVSWLLMVTIASTQTNSTTSPTITTTASTKTTSLCATIPYPTWCYYVEIFPSNTLTNTTVYITDIDRQSNVYFNITFIPRGHMCENPSITFEYEQIDVSFTTEYINIYDNANVLLKQCQGNGIADNQCNVWWMCLSQYNLNISQI